MAIIDVPVTMTVGMTTSTITSLVTDVIDTFLVAKMIQTTTRIKAGTRQGEDLDLDHLLGDIALLTLVPQVLGILDPSCMILDATNLQELQVVTACQEVLSMIIALGIELSRVRTSTRVYLKFQEGRPL